VREFKRPVILIGEGARGSPLKLVMELGVPVLTSWQAKDSVDNYHKNYFGSPGVYGNRAANKILYHADSILTLGNRMSIWNVGYEGPRPDQHLTMVDLDVEEVKKFPHALWVNKDCKEVVPELYWMAPAEWVSQCNAWREEHPWLESPTHDDANGYISAYRFTAGLQKYLSPDEIIVTDMGTALITAHQVLKLKPPQRLMTSGGLGEMGCALPAAIGASFATNKGKVICLHCDGGMMLNLQELQTIVHHKLPVKIIVYRNEGYGMIRQTQKNARMKEHGVHPDSGVSFPNFRHVALSFGITSGEIRTWEDYQRIIPGMLSCEGPALAEFYMDPREKMAPKLEPIMVDGKPTSPRFDQMSPSIDPFVRGVTLQKPHGDLPRVLSGEATYLSGGDYPESKLWLGGQIGEVTSSSVVPDNKNKMDQ
jgi:acetolactate synthase I/II/III large subunit